MLGSSRNSLTGNSVSFPQPQESSTRSPCWISQETIAKPFNRRTMSTAQNIKTWWEWQVLRAKIISLKCHTLRNFQMTQWSLTAVTRTSRISFSMTLWRIMRKRLTVWDSITRTQSKKCAASRYLSRIIPLSLMSGCTTRKTSRPTALMRYSKLYMLLREIRQLSCRPRRLKVWGTSTLVTVMT